ncbi:hypothetical protein ACN20G_33410 (plasmid) [Streptomyces sp. BI20]|uniref:hypothetical protein n=1 Tax=Streptomyces sp. BI20 TaxID=3403460 RepID=UPI003C706D82
MPSSPTRSPSIDAEPPEPGSWAAKMARLRARPVPEQVLRICDDEAARTRLDQAKVTAARLRMSAAETPAGSADLAAAEADLDTAQADFDAASIELAFRPVPRPVLDALVRAHPASEEQAEAGEAWDPATFPAAMISAAHVERDATGRVVDGMTVEEAQELLDTWPIAEANSLFAGAWQVQQVSRVSVSELGKD